jgi:hypothetical protein
LCLQYKSLEEMMAQASLAAAAAEINRHDLIQRGLDAE